MVRWVTSGTRLAHLASAALAARVDTVTRPVQLRNAGSVRPRGSLGAVPFAERQRQAWLQRIEELRREAEALEAAGGAVDEVVDLWLSIADRHPEPDERVDCYRHVLELCPDEPCALEALADVHEDAAEWEPAVRLLSALADAMGTAPRRAEIEHRIGRILWQEFGDDQRAEVHFLHACAMSGSHPPSVRALVRIYRDRGDWEAAAEILMRSEARTVSRSLRMELLLEAAAIHRDHLSRARAAELLETLLSIDPDYVPAVEALAELYCREERWEQAAPLLSRLGSHGDWWEEGAEPGRDDDAEDDALDRLLEPVPELAPSLGFEPAPEPETHSRRATTDILIIEDEVEAVAELEDPAEPLAEEPVDPAELERVWAEELDDEADAAADRAVASADDEMVPVGDDEPTNPAIEIGAAEFEEVVARVRDILAEDPRHEPSYRTLRSIFTGRGLYDQAWCVCAAMNYLGCATSRERLYYETYKPRRVARDGETLTGALWSHIVHPAVDPRVGVVARAIGRDVALMRAHPIRHHGLTAKDRRDIGTDQLALSRALEHAASLLQVDRPDLYLEPDRPGELSVENVVHRGQLSPSLVARGDVLRGRTPSELACIAGSTMTLLRPDFFLMVALPEADELRATWQAAMALANPQDRSLRGADGATDSVRIGLERALSSRARGELALAVNGSGLGFDQLDIAAWRAGVEITAQRVGLILSGDPAVAARALAGAPEAADRAAEIDALLLYAVSDDYFAVRRELDGTIGEGTRAGRLRPAA